MHSFDACDLLRKKDLKMKKLLAILLLLSLCFSVAGCASTECGHEEPIAPTGDNTFVFIVLTMMSMVGLVFVASKKRLF